MITLLFVLSAAQAQTAFEQAIAQHNQVRTREQWITLDGAPARLIQIGDKYYHLKIRPHETKPTAELLCNMVDMPPPKEVENTLVEGGRSKEFAQKVEKVCANSKSKVTIALDSSFIPLINEFDEGLKKNKDVHFGVTPGNGDPGMIGKKKF